jgi:integrase
VGIDDGKAKMPKIAKPLGALEVSRLAGDGLHAVGIVAGLYLSINTNGARSWILRTMVGNRRTDIGLGSYPAITLAVARERALEAKDSIRQGVDPVADKRAKRAVIEWTFDRCAAEYIAINRAGWKNAKHAQQWENTLASYASPMFGTMHVRDIGVSEVLSAIQPHWLTKNETMVRLRNRIELVLAWAAVRGYRAKENPAAWRGNLDSVLPKPGRVNKRQPHKALPYREINAFVSRLALAEGMSAKCLHFLILTATRSNEARGAQWSEIDLEAKTWTIPAERMKAGNGHRVPLPAPAIELLQSLPRFEGNDNVFQGRANKTLSDMSLTLHMRRMKVDAVPHGFRSTFSDWAAECTNYPVELREMALAHTIANKTQAAYQRGDMFERRRALMADWAAFVATTPSPARVVQIRGAA